MSERADAHAHLFMPGFVDEWPAHLQRIQPDEVTLYDALRQTAGITALLAVGFEGMPSTQGNNEYILGLAAEHSWIHPVLYVADPLTLTVSQLEDWRKRKGVGLSFYVHDEAFTDKLARVGSAIWKWLADHNWIISINSVDPFWSAWDAILAKHPLKLLMSHFASAVARSAEETSAPQLPATAIALAKYPSVGMKVSAFYAVGTPGYDYPHHGAWGYVEEARRIFGIDRLYWGSDFSPCLERVSFPQTYALLDQMPFLSDTDRHAINGANLLKLLKAVK